MKARTKQYETRKKISNFKNKIEEKKLLVVKKKDELSIFLWIILFSLFYLLLNYIN